MASGTVPMLEAVARSRARYLTRLFWSLDALVVINALFWLFNLGLGASGLRVSYWITPLWGIGLAWYVLVYLINGWQTAEGRTRRYLEVE